MNEVLDHIETRLIAGLQCDRRRVQRRRRALIMSIALGVAAAPVALATGVLDDPEPIQRALNGGAHPAGNERANLTVADAGDVRWSVTVYRTQDGLIGRTAAPEGLTDAVAPAGTSSGFVIADNLRFGAVADFSLDGATDAKGAHYLVSGLVRADTTRLQITLGQSTRAATLGGATLTVPVRKPAPPDLTDEGKRVAEQLPDSVDLRAFAVTFTTADVGDADFLASSATAISAQGTRHQQLARLCVSKTCGARLAQLHAVR